MSKQSAWHRIRKRGPVQTLPFEITLAAWRFLARVFACWILRAIYGMDIGRKCHLGQKIKVVYPNNVKICDEVTVESGVRLWAETAEGKIYLGARCLVGRDCILDFSGGLNIGEETVISEQVIIYTHSHGYDPAGKPTASSLVVGDKAWIGARAIILSSVKRIGDRAIIGAGTVVTRDVPDDMIYVGAEGRVVKKEDEKGENNNSRT